MKKLMLMAVVALMSGTAMAQNPDAVKQVLAASDYQTALSLIEAASGMTAEEKAKSYNKVVELAAAKYTKESEIALKNQVTGGSEAYDKEGMEAAAVAAVEYALVCDEYDNQPNEKGKVKAKYHAANVTRLVTVRNDLLTLGQNQLTANEFAKAGKSWGLFIDSAPMFVEGGLTAIPGYGQIAYFTAYAYYSIKDHANVCKYADLAQGDAEYAESALAIKLESMKGQLHNAEDSLKYVDELKAMYEANPTTSIIFGNLWDLYSSMGNDEAKEALLAHQLSVNPSNASVWVAKGLDDMGKSDWDAAVVSFGKSVEINEDYHQGRIYLAMCLNNKAITLKDANNGVMPDEGTACVNESIKNLLILREKDPNHEQVNWPYTLYQAYYLIGDEAGMSEVEPLVNR